MENSRTKNSIYNSMASLANSLTMSVLSFIVRTVFIRTLGEQCLGVDGLFSNILGLLSLTELGVGAAFSFTLYKPLAENNKTRISVLMTYYKRFCYLVAGIIALLGICIYPFLGFIAKDYYGLYNLGLIFGLYLLAAIISYLFNYPLLLMDSDQKGYKYFKYTLATNISIYLIQLLSLIIFPNLYVYLGINVICRTAESIIKNKFVRNYYGDIEFNVKEKLDKEEKKSIKKVLSGVVYHRIGNYIVDGTDNILISSLVNISTTGLYFNYTSITAVLKNIITSCANAVTASFGNLNVQSEKKIKENVFNTLNFGTYVVSGFMVVGLFFCITPFVKIWVGEKYLLSNMTCAVICINFYLLSIIAPVDSIKASTGIYYEDRYVPIIQAVINIVLSIILGKKMGLIGILLATTICKVTTVNWTKPVTLYKYVFESSSFKYFKEIFINCLIILVSVFIYSFISRYIILSSNILQFLTNGLISCGLYLLFCYIIYGRREEWKYFVNLFFGKIKRKFKNN